MLLAAQMTDDTHQVLHTEADNATERVLEPRPEEETEREKMCKTCNDRTRKESITPDFDLVTVTAYNDFVTPRPWTLQPDPNLQYRVSRHSPNFCPENFLSELSGQQTLHLTESK